MKYMIPVFFLLIFGCESINSTDEQEKTVMTLPLITYTHSISKVISPPGKSCITITIPSGDLDHLCPPDLNCDAMKVARMKRFVKNATGNEQAVFLMEIPLRSRTYMHDNGGTRSYEALSTLPLQRKFTDYNNRDSCIVSINSISTDGTAHISISSTTVAVQPGAVFTMTDTVESRLECPTFYIISRQFANHGTTTLPDSAFMDFFYY